MLANINLKLVSKLALFHIAIITLANYAVQFTITYAGYNFTWAMFVYPLVILATDLTIRLSNQHNARIIAAIAYLPAILISTYLAHWRIGLASGTAYLLGQLLDIAIFQKIRNHSTRWWPAPLISTLFANTIDTYIFFSLAFHRSSYPFLSENWVEVATTDLCFKIAVSIVVFLPAYGILLNSLKTRLASQSQP